jgi:histidine-containing phosphotransfer protein
MAAAALREQLNAHIDSMYASGMVDEQFQQLQMLQDDGSSPGFVAEVVTLFCDDADRIITELSKLLEQPTVDFDKVDAFVHQLKGSSASVGAQKVKFTCMQFRQLCQDKNRDGCIMALAVVRNEFCDVRNKFQTMLQLEQQIQAHQ